MYTLCYVGECVPSPSDAAIGMPVAATADDESTDTEDEGLGPPQANISYQAAGVGLSAGILAARASGQASLPKPPLTMAELGAAVLPPFPSINMGTKGNKRTGGRPGGITLKALIDEGIVQPGRGVLSVVSWLVDTNML